MPCTKGGWSQLITWNTYRYMVFKRSQVELTHWFEITAKVFNCTLGFLKIHLRIYLSTLKAKSYKGLVCFQVEYCWSVWDPRPGVENNNSYKIERIQRYVARWCLGWYKFNTSSLTNMLEDQHGMHGMMYPTCRTLSDWQLAHGPLKITRGLLSVNSHGPSGPCHVQDTSLTLRKFHSTSNEPVLWVSILFLKNNYSEEQ